MLQIVHNLRMADGMTSITVRCSVENKKLFIQAQTALGLTDLQSFVIMAAKDRAERVLKEREEAGLPIPTVDLPTKEAKHAISSTGGVPPDHSSKRSGRTKAAKA